MSDVNRPQLGPPAGQGEHDARCRYAPSPGDPRCPERAAVHLLLVAHPGQPQVLLQACGDHAGPARACGPVLGEHPFTGWCGFPAAFWDQPANACQLDDGGRRP